LATHANPFAAVILAHLKAQETRGDPLARRRIKTRLVKGLYERGWTAEDVRQLFRLIDWLMVLPQELQEGFRHDLYRFEEERHMPYLSSIERMAREEGLEKGRQEGLEKGLEEGLEKGLEKGRQEGRQEGRESLLEVIQTGLEGKFGAAGKKLLPKVRSRKNLAELRAVAQALMTADSLDPVRALLR
jgi:hypothetical protein